MTVAELIEELRGFDPDTEVRVAYTYPDHWSSELASEIAMVEKGEVFYSEYHQDSKVAEGDDVDEDTTTVVLLRS